MKESNCVRTDVQTLIAHTRARARALAPSTAGVLGPRRPLRPGLQPAVSLSSRAWQTGSPASAVVPCGHAEPPTAPVCGICDAGRGGWAPARSSRLGRMGRAVREGPTAPGPPAPPRRPSASGLPAALAVPTVLLRPRSAPQSGARGAHAPGPEKPAGPPGVRGLSPRGQGGGGRRGTGGSAASAPRKGTRQQL